MRETVLYSYHHMTSCGVVSLLPEKNGRYKVIISEENMGSYPSAQAAAEDVENDRIGSTPWDVNPDTLGIPEDVGDWNRKAYAVIKGLRPT